MRAAALYDIHGNAAALAAVLGDVPDDAAVVIGGDIAIGPQPLETLELLDGLGERARWIRGNCERREPHEDALWEERRLWTEAQLGDERAADLASLPETVALELEGLGLVLFCHGSPRSDEEMLTAVTSDERLRAILAGTSADVVVCGHTHHQFDRRVDGWRVVNAGSVGMAYEGAPGAHWALLGPDVKLRRTAYDLEAAERAIRASTYPGPDEQVETVLTAPPSAAEVAAHFERRAKAEDAA